MYKSEPNRQEQSELAVAVGARLREAREMIGLSQLNAAKMLGYANSTKLSKIETGRHSNRVSMWVLKRAAQVYDVSIDYLLGVTETMERGQKKEQHKEMMIHMREHWERLRERDVLVQSALNVRIERLEQGVFHLVDVSTDAHTAMARVIELNGRKWEGIRGGNRLADAVGSTVAAARTAQSKLRVLRKESVAPPQPQLDLVFI